MSDMPDYVRAVYTSVKNTWQDAENLDATHGYTTYIWIPEETFKEDIIKLHIYAEKFRAHSKAALAGGAQVKTSAAGGAHAHDVTGATSSSTAAAHTHDVTIGAQTSTSIGAHRHVMMQYTGAPAPNLTERGFAAVIGSGSAFILNLYTLLAEDLYTWEEAAAHAHSVDYGNKTSASGGASHSHTVNGQTAEAVTSHVHSVTIDAHVHAIDFGIYEEAIDGRTLSAILYDPDGNVLKDFGVMLTGEDSDIIDLSPYFATLKYGMYRMVLSASGRLRARLVFYELCKMYAQF